MSISKKELEEALLKQIPKDFSSKFSSHWVDEVKEEKTRAELVAAEARMRGAENFESKLPSQGLIENALFQAQARYNARLPTVPTDLVCPVCGEPDRGNKMNGKPWCFKCSTLLIPRDKLDKWKKSPRIKVADKSLRRELRRLNPGLYPEEEK